MAANLTYLRNRVSLTQKEVSERTGIPKGTLSCYENYGSISKERAELLCDFYGVDMDLITLYPDKFISAVENHEA